MCFEATAVIITLTLLSQILELKAHSQTSAAIKSLLGLALKLARRINADGAERAVPLTYVHVCDWLRVRLGNRASVGGFVIEGGSAVGEFMRTGEPVRVIKRIGDDLIGATLKAKGRLVMCSEKVGVQAVLASIAQKTQRLKAASTKPARSRKASRASNARYPQRDLPKTRCCV